MKQLTYEAVFQCSLQEFIEVLYGDDKTFYQGYHKTINKDPTAEVDEWDHATHTRLIRFTPNVPLPSVIKRTLGMDADKGMKVQETQKLQYERGAAQACLLSESYPMLKRGERFMTKMRIEYRTGADGNCHATISVSIEATIWGMQAMLEGFMVETAGQAFQNFLEYTHNFLASAGVGHALVIGKARSEADEFFDADEIMDWRLGALVQGDSDGEESAAWGDDAQNPTVSSWFMHSVLRDLSELRLATQAMRASAVANEMHMRALRAELALARADARRAVFYHRAYTLAAVGAGAFMVGRYYLQIQARLQRS